MNGVSVLDNNQLADNHTFVDHKSANCRSNEMYKGIFIFLPKIVVERSTSSTPAKGKKIKINQNDNSQDIS